ncbi:MAG: helix-turn-helix transcriptional regulator [Elusimicrobiota bacterium]
MKSTGRTLGEEIRRRRMELDIPLRKFAEKVDVSPAHMSDIENGNRNPSDELLAKIAENLRAPVDELKKFDSRINSDVRKWAENHPSVGVMLRHLKDSGQDPDVLMKDVLKKLSEDKGT